jgi:hypothetical protein
MRGQIEKMDGDRGDLLHLYWTPCRVFLRFKPREVGNSLKFPSSVYTSEFPLELALTSY